MRPQDVSVLLKIAISGINSLQFKDLSASLFLSASEISESLNRSRIAGLIDGNKKKVFQQALLEFLTHGLHYVFPVVPGAPTVGIATGHSYPFMKKIFSSDENYVWPDADGNMRGLSIEPLYPGTVKAAKLDDDFHKLLALVDVLRVGRSREEKIAVSEIQKILVNGSSK